MPRNSGRRLCRAAPRDRAFASGITAWVVRILAAAAQSPLSCAGFAIASFARPALLSSDGMPHRMDIPAPSISAATKSGSTYSVEL